MRAIRADAARNVDIAAHEEQNAARLADRRVSPRRRLPPRIIIVAIDDGGAGRKRPQDRFGVFNAAAVGQEGEAERRRRAAKIERMPFERVGGGC